jgi:hypothetical protein
VELVVKDNRLAMDGLLCFEIGVAGALADFLCILIRGIFPRIASAMAMQPP